MWRNQQSKVFSWSDIVVVSMVPGDCPLNVFYLRVRCEYYMLSRLTLTFSEEKYMKTAAVLPSNYVKYNFLLFDQCMLIICMLIVLEQHTVIKLANYVKFYGMNWHSLPPYMYRVLTIIFVSNIFLVFMYGTLKLFSVLRHSLNIKLLLLLGLVGWDQNFLCCSLDKTVNLWSASEYGNLEVMHTHSKDLASSTHFLIWISRSVLFSQNSIEVSNKVAYIS
jgi:hypothetical protein